MGLRHQLEVIQVSYNALECEKYCHRKFVHDYMYLQRLHATSTNRDRVFFRFLEQYLSAHKGHFTAILYYYDAYVM